MRAIFRGGVMFLAVAALACSGFAAEKPASHHIAIQVSQNDPERMNLALNNSENAIKYYTSKSETIEVEIVAYGPGLNMLREDTSPVKDRITRLRASDMGGHIHFSACHNTLTAMEKREAHPIKIIPEATIVPSGVVRLTRLQEEGWSYIRP